MKDRVRLEDVANAAGVSLGTASNVFARPERVRPALRERVRAAAKALGYIGPDPKARLLMAGKANAIGLLTHDPLTLWTETEAPRDFTAGVAEACDEKGAALLLISATNEEAAIKAMQAALVDGLILHIPNYMLKGLPAVAKARGLPMVTVETETALDVNRINADSRGGAAEGARHLLRLGHRRFFIQSHDTPHFGKPPSSVSYRGPHSPERRGWALHYDDASKRWLGFADAFREVGISIEDVPTVEAIWPPADLEVARLVLDKLDGATAVLAMADRLALAILAEAKQRGIRVPQDLSVVGFDNIAEAARGDPPLTTISQSLREQGRAAARLIFDPPDTPQHVIIPTRLIVRNSTAAPAK
jgi:DNA-binding LacI/PurR family transcriptional regulator